MPSASGCFIRNKFPGINVAKDKSTLKGVTNMNTIQRVISAVATVGLMATASLASATVFTVSAASFAPESGYGIEKNELDVFFSTSAFSAQTFTLETVGASKKFDFGLINFRETDIKQSQTGSLGVVASLTFTSPLAQAITVNAAGTAYVGPANDSTKNGKDSTVDYEIKWTPTIVDFGSGGRFQLDLSNLLFTGNGVQTEFATVTLLNLPTQAPAAGQTPEPGTVALIGLGLLGFAASRRKVAKK